MECHVPLVVKINAPHILSLTIEEDLKLGKVVLLNVSSLVEAKLNYYYESDEPKSEDESDEPASEDESDEPASGDESDEPTSEDESDEPTSDDESDFPTSWKKREKILKGLILSLRHVKNLKIGSHCQETLARLEAKGFTFPLNNDGLTMVQLKVKISWT
nr:hypothetical protein [Tanacetum cinerariifolium]